MVFSINTVKSASKRSFPINEANAGEDSISFFFESLRLISENNRNTYQLFESFHKTDNNQILQEKILSFSDLLRVSIKRVDYKKIFSKIIAGFIHLLETLWNHLHAFLLNLFGEDRVIKLNKEKLNKINISIDFKDTRCIYSNLGYSTSYTSFKSELEKELSSLILDLTKIGSLSSYNKMKYMEEIEELKEKTYMREEDIDLLRGNILGQNTPIQKENFAKALYKYFRNNGYKVSPGRISPEEMRNIYIEYSESKSNIKVIADDKNKLIKESKNIQTQIMGIKLESYISDTIPQEASSLFIIVLENKCRKVKLICDLYSEVFGAKLDAVKELYIQNKRILFTACKELTKEGL